MQKMKSLSLMVLKLWRRLKFTTDRQTIKQTGQKQYAPDHSIKRPKKVKKLFSLTCKL